MMQSRMNAITKLDIYLYPYQVRHTFEYTREGIFLGLIIKSRNLKNVITTARAKHEINDYKEELEKTYQDIYDILALLFKANKNSSANTVFYSNLYKKCKDKSVFNQFINPTSIKTS
jgi:hypothetical protein